MNTALTLIEHASTSFPDQSSTVYIMAKICASCLEAGVPIDLTQSSLRVVNSGLIADGRNYAVADSDINALAVNVYAQGSDPVSREVFNTVFGVSPVSKLLISWQEQGGNPDTYAFVKILEAEGIHGPALLGKVRDFIHQTLPNIADPFDEYLKGMLKSNVDRNIIVYNALVVLSNVIKLAPGNRLGDVFPRHMDGQTYFTGLALGNAGNPPVMPPTISTPPSTGGDITTILNRFNQEQADLTYWQFGSPVDMDFTKDVAETSHLTSQLLDQGGVGALFDAHVASQSVSPNGEFQPVAWTPYRLGVCLNTAFNTTMVSDAKPRRHMDLDTQSPRLKAWQKINMDLTSGKPALPFDFHQPGKPGTVNGPALIEYANFTRALLYCPAHELSQLHKQSLQNVADRARQVSQTVSKDPTLGKAVVPMGADLSKLNKANGLSVTSYLWRVAPRSRHHIWTAPTALALQGEMGLVLTFAKESVLVDRVLEHEKEATRQEQTRKIQAIINRRKEKDRQAGLAAQAKLNKVLNFFTLGWYGSTEQKLVVADVAKDSVPVSSESQSEAIARIRQRRRDKDKAVAEAVRPAILLSPKLSKMWWHLLL
jgi:hypothetical protein